MTIPAPDPQTFDWIKGALDGSMNAVMSQVQQAEREADITQLATVPGNLHQINGSLRMVELEAAGILAEDLEALCQKICSEVEQAGPESSSADLSGLSILREGLDALRVYIDAISRQTPVSPLGLVDHINTIRRQTGRDLISRFELFHPPLTLIHAGSGGADDEDEEHGESRRVPDDLRVRLVGQLRRKYRRALVSWLANRNRKGGSEHYLGKINDLLNHLFRISSLDVSQQLWWVAGGFVEAVASGDIDTDKRIKSQFARLDIEISRLEEENTSGIAVDPPDLLLRQMLFHIGAVEGSQSERVRQIQDNLNLSEWFDRDDSEYRKLVTTSAELSRLGEHFDPLQFAELESVVNNFFASYLGEDRSEGGEGDALVKESLGKLRGAVDQHGPQTLSELIGQLDEAVTVISKNPETIADTQADIKVASALLFVRDSVSRPDSIDASWPQSLDSHLVEIKALADPSSVDSERTLRVRKIAEVEYQHAKSAIAAQLREILGGLEKLLAAPGNAARAAGFDASALTEAATAMGQVSNVLSIAENQAAADVAGELSSLLAAFGDSGQEPADDNLEHMAFAVAALGVAADHLSRRGPEADNVLAAAQDRLSQVDPGARLLPENEADKGQPGAAIVTADSAAAESGGEDPIDSGDQVETSAVALISELDYRRRQLRPGSHDGIRGLSENFEALAELQDAGQGFADDSVVRLADMGRTICGNLLEQEDGIDPERRDFLGLLVRQLGEIIGRDGSSAGSNEDVLDLDAWQRRLQSLTARDTGVEQQTDDPAEPMAGGSAESAVNDDEVSGPIDEPVHESDDGSDDTFGDESSTRLEAEQSVEALETQDPTPQPDPETAPDQPVSIAESISLADDNTGLLKLDADLRAIFVEEFGAHLHTLREELNNYRLAEDDSDSALGALREIDDCIHTLSGNCRNLGFDSAADCAEIAAAGLLSAGSDANGDARHRSMARFAEALIMLGQVRQQVRVDGTVNAETEDRLLAYVSREASQPAVETESESQEDPDPEPESEADAFATEADADYADPGNLEVDGADQTEDSQTSLADSTQAESAEAAEEDPEPELATAADQADQDDEIDEEIREIFIEESKDILARINGHLMSWRADGVEGATLSGIRREFHTLKGSAAATGFSEISELSHRVESLLEQRSLDASDTDDLFSGERAGDTLNLLEELHDGLAADLGIMPSEAKGHLSQLSARLDGLLGLESTQPDGSEPEIRQEPLQEPVTATESDVVAADSESANVGEPDHLDDPRESVTRPEEHSQTATAAVGEEPVTEAVPAADQIDVDEEIDAEIREIFIEESEEILTRINAHLMAWRAAGMEDAMLSGIRREFHTLKGSAAATGFTDISELSHRIESLIDHRSLDPTDSDDLFGTERSGELLNMLEETHDGLAADLGIMPSEVKGHLPLLSAKLDSLLGLKPAQADLAEVDTDESGENGQEATEPSSETDSSRESADTGERELADEAADDADNESDVALDDESDESLTAPSEDQVEKAVREEVSGATGQDNAREKAIAGPEVQPQPEDNVVPLDLPDDQHSTRGSEEADANIPVSNIVPMPLGSDDDPDAKATIGERSGEVAASDASVEDQDQAAGSKSWMPQVDESGEISFATDEASPGSMLRIGNSRLAELINASGELGLVRSQLQDTLDATRMDLDVLRASMSSMRAGLRDLELEADAQIRARPEQQSVSVDDDFDPLQLDRYSRLQAKSREVTELLDQLAKVERDLDNRASNLDGALRQQLHLGDQLQTGLMSARMVNMTDYLPRLRYLVRETSKQADKPVELRFNGGDIQVDRQVIETMMAPLEHMIRNSVAHGIEGREVRKRAEKPETGSIVLNLAQQGSELVVTFSDDGGGLNLEKLNARAVELGLAESAAGVSDVHLLQVITQPGYSTADALTMESGRGVGMDVVYQAVRDLGGSMTLNNKPGYGTTFQFRLPVTLALTQALMVRAGGWRFAVRSRTIERLMRVSVEDVQEQDGSRYIEVDDQPVVLYSVRERLGDTSTIENSRWLSVVLVRLADRLAAFEVDSFSDSVNIVAKSSGRQLASIPEISGVTVLGDSSMVLILDPEAFIDRIAPVRAEVEPEEDARRPNQLRRVLVVDDSLVVRKVMQKDLEADGLEVETAVDGVNALEVLGRSAFDIALVDIEMPRMNGYELLERLRADSRYQSLPVIIITSRSGNQHRERAMSLGADGYITKPYDISVLDGLMREVINARSVLH